MIDYDSADKKSDAELIRLTLEDQQNFLYVVKRYERKLLSYVMRISNVSREEAEDILQDVFIKIYTNLNDFDQTLKFSSWAYRITHNQVISHYRQHKAHAQDLHLDHDLLLNALITDAGIDQHLDQKYLRERIHQVLDRLDFKYREVLILKFLEEKNYQEISDIIKKPMGTVGTLINRAKKQFKIETARQAVNLAEI